MRFNNSEIQECSNMFNTGYSTLDVQHYLMNKYKCSKSDTSNFVKKVRKLLGIYKKSNLTTGQLRLVAINK